MNTLIRNARVLTMDDQDRELDRTDILVRGDTIAEIGPDLRPTDADLRVIDAAGKLAMPGLVNAHFHSAGNFMRGGGYDLPLELYMLFEVPPYTEKPPSPRLNYVRTMLGAIEMVKHGATSVNDDTYYNPYPTREAIDGTMQAYADIGMRATVKLSQPIVVEHEKFPFLGELLPEHLRKRMDDAPRLSGNEMLALYDDYIERWHGKADGRLHVGLSISAPQRVPIDYFGAMVEMSKNRDLAFDLHILETKVQRVLGQVKHGKSLVRYSYDLGFLQERTLVIHSIWVDEHDMEVMADSGSSVAHNPVCNLKIGSGIMPFRRLLNHGINVCMGADEIGADDTCNMWGVGKTAGIMHRVGDPDYRTWPTAHEILSCLTRNGARAMWRQHEMGQLALGFQADIILLDLNTLAFTPLNDLRRQLVFCENGSSVVMTMIGGKLVAENGRVLTVDEEAIKAEARELMKEYQQEIDAAGRSAKELEPYYREMYFRAVETDVGMSRWAPMTP